jgi:O-antigen biosynthesis protein
MRLESGSTRSAAIDIIVPVYNACDDLRRCLASVRKHTARNHRLILLDDASPQAEVGRYFDELAQERVPNLSLLRNAHNLGFVGTVNRAMSLSQNDVVLLNSDTIVTSGWLDKLTRCARSDVRIATITPFSNNAEICSLPRFCENNPWPADADPEILNRALERAALPTYPDLPTGVGFCFYIRRRVWNEIGPFDPAFGLGYGEENDFCMRAAAAGYRNVLCEDTLVLHLGNRSFDDKKRALSQTNMQLLLQRHPSYLTQVHAFIAADPLRPLRDLALAYHRRLLVARRTMTRRLLDRAWIEWAKLGLRLRRGTRGARAAGGERPAPAHDSKPIDRTAL